MTVFTAGRFRVVTHEGAHGEATRIYELHSNGSDQVIGTLQVGKDELPDLQYVLLRAVYAHKQFAILSDKVVINLRAAQPRPAALSTPALPESWWPWSWRRK